MREQDEAQEQEQDQDQEQQQGQKRALEITDEVITGDSERIRTDDTDAAAGVNGEPRQCLFGQLEPTTNERQYRVYLSGDNNHFWKQPKTYYERMQKTGGLSFEQRVLAKLIRNKLITEFMQSNNIADGTCNDSSYAQSSRTVDMAQQAAAAGGMVPLIGPTIVVSNLFFSAIRYGNRELDNAYILRKCSLVKNFISDIDDIIAVSGNVAMVLAVIYGNPIAKLSHNGLVTFANYLVEQMIGYIASNKGREPNQFMFVVKGAASSISSLLQYFGLYSTPSADSAEVSKEKILLDSILCYSPNSQAGKSLKKNDECQTPCFTIRDILTARIKTWDGDCYTDSYDRSDKYGYRLLPREYAESTGYTIKDNTRDYGMRY